MVNESLLFGLFSMATGVLGTLLNIAMIAVGLVYVRRVNTFAGLCFVGAGILGAFASLIQRLTGLAMSLIGNMSVYTIVQIFTTLLSLLGGALIPVGIFLLANTIKQNAASQNRWNS